MRAIVTLAVVAACLQVAVATQPKVKTAASGSVVFYAPTASSTWYSGVTYTISYSTTAFPSSSTSISIAYQNVGDYGWTTITSYASITGTYSWYVPSYLSSGSYRLWISDNASFSSAAGFSDYFDVNGDSSAAAALAVGWIVFIVIAVCCCVACAVCVQYRRRQQYWAANSRYAALGGATTTTVITIPPGAQPPMHQPSMQHNPALIYAPDQQPPQYAAGYQPPHNAAPPQYNPYAQPQGVPQGVPQYLPPGQYPGGQSYAQPQYTQVVPVYAAPPAYAPVVAVTPVQPAGGTAAITNY